MLASANERHAIAQWLLDQVADLRAGHVYTVDVVEIERWVLAIARGEHQPKGEEP